MREYGTNGMRVWAEKKMLPLYHDPRFILPFSDGRIIPRLHPEGVEPGRRVKVFKIDPGPGRRLGLLAIAAVGEGVSVRHGRTKIIKSRCFVR